MTKKFEISDFGLKCIALVFMVLDHAGEYFGLPIYFRYIGRLAAPIFIFCCVQGCIHTKDLKKYMFRLYIASCVMSIFSAYSQMSVNFFRTLFSIALIIYIIEKYKETSRKSIWVYYILWQLLTSIVCYLIGTNPWIDLESVGTFVFPALFGNLLFLEGGVFYVVIGVWFYYAKDNVRKMAIGYVLIVSIFIFGMQSNPYFVYGIPRRLRVIPLLSYVYDSVVEMLGFAYLNIGVYWYTEIKDNYQWMMIGAVPFLIMYNNKSGHKVKWFFYVFYPLHYILFWYLGNLERFIE